MIDGTVADIDMQDKIREIELNLFKKFGIKNISQVYMNNDLQSQFYRQRNKTLFEKYGWKHIQSKYQMKSTHSDIAYGIGMIFSEIRNELNLKIVDRMLEELQNKQKMLQENINLEALPFENMENKKYSNKEMYININPYNALYQCKNSGADIIAPEEIRASIDIIQHDLNQLLSPETIKMLSLIRLDFCMNLIFMNQSHANEYMKLLKKGIPQKALAEKTYFDLVQHRFTSYKDALLLECKSYSFEIYSKYHQMLARKMQNPDAACGMIRLELRASKTKILQLAIKYNLFFTSQNYIAFLPKAPDISRQEIPSIMAKMVGTECFHTYQYISDKIESSDFKDSDRELMLQIIKYLSKHTAKQNLLDDLNLSNQKWNKILKKFNKLGCSPVPVPLSFRTHTYPGVAVWDASF